MTYSCDSGARDHSYLHVIIITSATVNFNIKAHDHSYLHVIIITSATVNFNIKATMSAGKSLHVAMLDRDGEIVDQASNVTNGSLKAANFKPWWPWTESKADYTYMYTLQVTFSMLFYIWQWFGQLKGMMWMV